MHTPVKMLNDTYPIKLKLPQKKPQTRNGGIPQDRESPYPYRPNGGSRTKIYDPCSSGSPLNKSNTFKTIESYVI